MKLGGVIVLGSCEGLVVGCGLMWIDAWVTSRIDLYWKKPRSKDPRANPRCVNMLASHSCQCEILVRKPDHLTMTDGFGGSFPALYRGWEGWREGHAGKLMSNVCRPLLCCGSAPTRRGRTPLPRHPRNSSCKRANMTGCK
jgi:hypothetical protein